MKIKKLSLNSFRGFYKEENKEVDDKIITEIIPTEITFPDDNICVFIGENGSGKSSILDAIAISLTNLLTKGNQSYEPLMDEKDSKIVHQNNGYELVVDDINTQALSSSIELLVELNGEDFSIYTTASLNKEKDNLKSIDVKIDARLIHNLKSILESAYGNIPTLAYYNLAKIIIDNSNFKPNFEEKNKLSQNQFYAYRNSFTKNIMDVEYFSNWFRGLEDLENEFRLREQEDQREPFLEVIRLAINNFIGIISEGLFADFKITRQRSFGIGTFSLTVQKKETELKLSQLSAGEKAILMLVADIARRVSIANPGLYVDDTKDRLPDYTNNVLQNATGIVIIDEIDLHLHPKWQRLVVPALTSTFPNVQFIITTHSPLVLNQIQDTSSILLINNQKVVSLKEYLSGYNTYGADIERIIKSVMEVESIYPSHVQELFNELNTLLDEDRIEDAKFKKQELEKLIDPFHPELLKAQTTIDYKEMMKE